VGGRLFAQATTRLAGVQFAEGQHELAHKTLDPKILSLR